MMKNLLTQSNQELLDKQKQPFAKGSQSINQTDWQKLKIFNVTKKENSFDQKSLNQQQSLLPKNSSINEQQENSPLIYQHNLYNQLDSRAQQLRQQECAQSQQYFPHLTFSLNENKLQRTNSKDQIEAFNEQDQLKINEKSSTQFVIQSKDIEQSYQIRGDQFEDKSNKELNDVLSQSNNNQGVLQGENNKEESKGFQIEHPNQESNLIFSKKESDDEKIRSISPHYINFYTKPRESKIQIVSTIRQQKRVEQEQKQNKQQQEKQQCSSQQLNIRKVLSKDEQIMEVKERENYCVGSSQSNQKNLQSNKTIEQNKPQQVNKHQLKGQQDLDVLDISQSSFKYDQQTNQEQNKTKNISSSQNHYDNKKLNNNDKNIISSKCVGIFNKQATEGSNITSKIVTASSVTNSTSTTVSSTQPPPLDSLSFYQQFLSNPEGKLREITGNQELQVFDLHFIFKLLNKKYGTQYQLRDFSIFQKIEQREFEQSCSNKLKDKKEQNIILSQDNQENQEEEEEKENQDQSDERERVEQIEKEKEEQRRKDVELLQNKIWNSIKAQNQNKEKQQQENQQMRDTATSISTFNRNNCELSVPFVTAKSWAIYDGKKCIPLWTKGVDLQCEIASLTKIMTAYVVCNLIEEYNLNPKNVYLRVSRRASTIGGTSAFLKEGQRLSIYELLIGLMLPSGNDAAIVLAEHFGRLLLLEKTRVHSQLFKEATELDAFSTSNIKIFIKKFVKRMNYTAKSLKMMNTQYSNPHGLADKANKSTACNIIRLAFYALKHEIFKQIVQMKKYSTNSVFQINLQTHEYKLVSYQWVNSNKLLNNKGIVGVKTGYTANAGSCLCTHYIDESKKINLLVTLLCAKTNDHRFSEMEKLIQWAVVSLQQTDKRAQTPLTLQH